MSDKDSKLEQLESSRGRGVMGGADGMREAGPLTRGQKIKRHYRKWWWAHLLAIVCIVVLVVCLM